MDRPKAVGPGVAAPDDRDALGAGADPRQLQRALADEVRRFQIVHGEVHAPQVTPGHGEVTRARGAARQHDGVEFGSKGVGREHRHVRRCSTGDLLGVQRVPPPHLDARTELRPLFFHLGEAPVQHRLIQLERGDAVAQQATDALGTLEDHHRVPGPGELLGRREPGGARTDDRHVLSGPSAGPVGRERSGAGRPLGGLELDLLDQHRLGNDPEHARALARRRA